MFYLNLINKFIVKRITQCYYDAYRNIRHINTRKNISCIFFMILNYTNYLKCILMYKYSTCTYDFFTGVVFHFLFSFFFLKLAFYRFIRFPL